MPETKLLKGIKMNTFTKTLAVALSATFLGSVAVSTLAAEDTQFEKNHPRREQVNNRLNNQNKRIKDEVKDGDLTKAQGKKLHREDRQIRREERAMASQNGGHITAQEQKTLNQQENVR